MLNVKEYLEKENLENYRKYINLFSRIKINDKLVKITKIGIGQTYLTIYNITDIDENTVYVEVIFSQNSLITHDAISDVEINEFGNHYYLISELDKEDTEKIKNIIFNFILGIDK